MSNIVVRHPDCQIVETENLPAAMQETGIVTVERLRSLQDLVGSIYGRVQEIKKIYAYNYNRGRTLGEMGPYEAPFDFKLNQLDRDVTLLFNDLQGTPPPPDQPIATNCVQIGQKD